MGSACGSVTWPARCASRVGSLPGIGACALAAMLSLLSFTNALWAQEHVRQPSTAAATTRPADPADDIAPEPSTPKGTLLLVSRALAVGDTATARQLIHAVTPQDQKLLDLLMSRTQANANFRRAAADAFGAEAASQLAADPAAELAQSEQRIRQADVAIDGDQATVQMDNNRIELLRQQGQWKLAMSNLTAGMDAADVERHMRLMQVFRDVVVQTTQELTAGEYKTVEQVSDAIRSKLASEMLKASTAPTTAQASTQPTE
ncbi:MAG TPA: hypothetical protein VNL70_10240 [Tepidisphaeraceae bacterium]|nr:hypothetical protein [Tepidisphaeraceae bacterium]